MSQNAFKCIEPHRFGDLITCFTGFINSIRSLCVSDTYRAMVAVALGLCGNASGQLGMRRVGESECVYTLAAGTCEEDWGLVLPGSLNPPNSSQTRGSVYGMRVYGVGGAISHRSGAWVGWPWQLGPAKGPTDIEALGEPQDVVRRKGLSS